MFKLEPNPTFWATVEIPMPGETEPGSIRFCFRHKSRAAMKDFYQSGAGKEDQQYLGEIIEDWDGVETPYSLEALGRLLDNYPSAGRAILAAYGRELVEGSRKN